MSIINVKFFDIQLESFNVKFFEKRARNHQTQLLQYEFGQLGPQQTFNLNPDEYPAREIQYSTIEFWPTNNS